MSKEIVFQPVIKELIQYYYDELGNSAGGFCHIVLDDGNLDDESIWFCQQECEKHKDQFGYFVMTVLRSFPVDEREKMYSENWFGMRKNK